MKIIFGIIFFVADADRAVLCIFEGGRTADKNWFRNNFDFIADTDTEKYYFLNYFRYEFGQNGSLCTPKSQWFWQFAIAMPIADSEIASDFRDKTKQCCIAI